MSFTMHHANSPNPQRHRPRLPRQNPRRVDAMTITHDRHKGFTGRHQARSEGAIGSIRFSEVTPRKPRNTDYTARGSTANDRDPGRQDAIAHRSLDFTGINRLASRHRRQVDWSMIIWVLCIVAAGVAAFRVTEHLLQRQPSILIRTV